MLFPTVVILGFLALSGVAQGAKCPTITTQKDFDATKYAGLWYEAYRSNVIFEIGSKCVNATYTLNADGSVGVFNQAINILGQSSTIRGSAVVKNSAEPAALEVTFENQGQKGDYNVIETDYADYSLVYACNNIPIIGKWEFIWILSRNKTVSSEVFTQLKKTLADMGVDSKSLKPTKQDC